MVVIALRRLHLEGEWAIDWLRSLAAFCRLRANVLVLVPAPADDCLKGKFSQC